MFGGALPDLFGLVSANIISLDYLNFLSKITHVFHGKAPINVEVGFIFQFIISAISIFFVFLS